MKIKNIIVPAVLLTATLMCGGCGDLTMAGYQIDLANFKLQQEATAAHQTYEDSAEYKAYIATAAYQEYEAEYQAYIDSLLLVEEGIIAVPNAEPTPPPLPLGLTPPPPDPADAATDDALVIAQITGSMPPPVLNTTALIRQYLGPPTTQ